MNILGIDTSCDDTSAALFSENQGTLSSVVHSQVSVHQAYGGVVPELASREHLRSIVPAVSRALSQARMRLKDIDGIAVTIGPGLIGSLLVGLNYAKSVAYGYEIPFVGVNHLEGHVLSIFLEKEAPSFPFVALTVSGGHTSLYHVKEIGEYLQLGQTLDDAAGEAFDKVSKILELGYPGGAAVEKAGLAGNPGLVRFPKPFLSRGSLDFSFSGLKTAVALFVKKWREGGGGTAGITLADIAAAFQEAVVEVLVVKTMEAAARTGVDSIVVAGGVACNKALRTRMEEEGQTGGYKVYYPRPSYCTDNAAMIAFAGYHRINHGKTSDLSVDVKSRFPIEDLVSLKNGQRVKGIK
ncbi:MAG: tRNA (adenosine(37)-N6)-threonylcarbamoyltransferase complex transferase subunit TsaD [Desulfobacterales bacterium]|nr:tRNA (adenosine(37)-N6)-threonylcarbamoyltransferase complex transferase subunit TsaD [Desulfobacterales bacterium]